MKKTKHAAGESNDFKVGPGYKSDEEKNRPKLSETPNDIKPGPDGRFLAG